MINLEANHIGEIAKTTGRVAGILIAANIIYGCTGTMPTEPRSGYVESPVSLSAERINIDKGRCKDFARAKVKEKYEGQFIDDLKQPWNILLEGAHLKQGNLTPHQMFDFLYKGCLGVVWKKYKGK